MTKQPPRTADALRALSNMVADASASGRVGDVAEAVPLLTKSQVDLKKSLVLRLDAVDDKVSETETRVDVVDTRVDVLENWRRLRGQVTKQGISGETSPGAFAVAIFISPTPRPLEPPR